jgi:hypothetical protein
MKACLLIATLVNLVECLISTDRPVFNNIGLYFENTCLCLINDDIYNPLAVYIVTNEDGEDDVIIMPVSNEMKVNIMGYSGIELDQSYLVRTVDFIMTSNYGEFWYLVEMMTGGSIFVGNSLDDEENLPKCG